MCCTTVSLDPEHGHRLMRRPGAPAAWPRVCVGIQIAAQPLGPCPSCGGARLWQPDIWLSTACRPVCCMANILFGDLTRGPGSLCISELGSQCAQHGMNASGQLPRSLPLISHSPSSQNAARDSARAFNSLLFIHSLPVKWGFIIHGKAPLSVAIHCLEKGLNYFIRF